MPSSSRIRRCSSDCGFQPSVAATTNTQAVDATDAGEHVAQEPHVTGHVDEAELLTGRQRHVREAEIDRQPAALLLLEAVGVGAGQREHERRLAVVDVTGRRDDGHVTGRCAFSAAMIVVSSAGSTDRRSSIVRSSRERAITGRS